MLNDTADLFRLRHSASFMELFDSDVSSVVAAGAKNTSLATLDCGLQQTWSSCNSVRSRAAIPRTITLFVEQKLILLSMLDKPQCPMQNKRALTMKMGSGLFQNRLRDRNGGVTVPQVPPEHIPTHSAKRWRFPHPLSWLSSSRITEGKKTIQVQLIHYLHNTSRATEHYDCCWRIISNAVANMPMYISCRSLAVRLKPSLLAALRAAAEFTLSGRPVLAALGSLGRERLWLTR